MKSTPAPAHARADAPAPVPDLAWSPARAHALGEQVIDLWEELLARLPELPAGTPRTEEEVRAAVARPIPDAPTPMKELMAYLRSLVLEHSTLTGHPGFMAFISGAGTIPGAAADLIAAAINQNVGGWRLAPGATEIEQALMRWFAAKLGLPASARGFMTTGGAMAAHAALKMARDAKAGWQVRRDGVASAGRLTMYASSEAHVVNTRAADMLGLGSDAVRMIPVDERLTMRVDLLREAIARDRSEGATPIVVIATAGTVGTGAIDSLSAIADLCEAEGLWLHVDGAYGGVAALTDELKPMFAGIERADSVALDPHKWLYTPHSGGVVLVRDGANMSRAFGIHASYVAEDKEYTQRGADFFELTPNFSRGFSALKVWFSLLAHGWTAYSRRIVHDTELARWLHERVVAAPLLQPVGPAPTLSITCFRYVPADLRGDASAEPYLNALNERLVTELQNAGRVFPSNALIDGVYAIRSCIVNFRTEAEDVEALAEEAVRLGGELDREMRGRQVRVGES